MLKVLGFGNKVRAQYFVMTPKKEKNPISELTPEQRAVVRDVDVQSNLIGEHSRRTNTALKLSAIFGSAVAGWSGFTLAKEGAAIDPVQSTVLALVFGQAFILVLTSFPLSDLAVAKARHITLQEELTRVNLRPQKAPVGLRRVVGRCLGVGALIAGSFWGGVALEQLPEALAKQAQPSPQTQQEPAEKPAEVSPLVQLK